MIIDNFVISTEKTAVGRDEWALKKSIDKFPVVIIPEQFDMSSEMIDRCKAYAKNGGILIITGEDYFDRFGSDFLGCTMEDCDLIENSFIESDNGVVPLYKESRKLAMPTSGKKYGTLYKTNMMGENESAFPPAAILAQLSRSPTVRLTTSLSGVALVSSVK